MSLSKLVCNISQHILTIKGDVVEKDVFLNLGQKKSQKRIRQVTYFCFVLLQESSCLIEIRLPSEFGQVWLCRS